MHTRRSWWQNWREYFCALISLSCVFFLLWFNSSNIINMKDKCLRKKFDVSTNILELFFFLFERIMGFLWWYTDARKEGRKRAYARANYCLRERKERMRTLLPCNNIGARSSEMRITCGITSCFLIPWDQKLVCDKVWNTGHVTNIILLLFHRKQQKTMIFFQITIHCKIS